NRLAGLVVGGGGEGLQAAGADRRTRRRDQDRVGARGVGEAGGRHEVDRVVDDVGAEKSLAGDVAAADDGQVDRVHAGPQGAGRNVVGVELVIAAIRAAGNAAAVEVPT